MAFKKYGLENFQFNIVAEDSEERIKELEIELITSKNTVAPFGYNLTSGGEGSQGFKHSKETRKKMSQGRSGTNNAMFGKQHSVATRRKLSLRASERILTPQRLKLLQSISQGAKNRHARPIQINGVKYEYLKQAACALNIKHGTLRTYVCRFERTGRWPKSLNHLKIILLQKELEQQNG
jgi:group I intron endonuclease